MKAKNDNPGVYIPPPVFFISIFLLSILIQKYFPLSPTFFESNLAAYLSIASIGLGILFGLPAVITFLKTRNTVATMKPATSLQTKGMYTISRNPMYVGTLFIYIGMAFWKGNWWTFILIPVVIVAITHFVIIHEEKYLERAFGQAYLNYKNKVKRWL